MKVYIIEDDKDIAELIEYHLKREDFVCEMFSRGGEALQRIKRAVPDLVILDLMLPDANGFEICAALKENSKTHDVPVLILTSKSAEIDRVKGLENGADDYMTKPFSPRELVLRTKAILRRASPKSVVKSPRESFGLLTIDSDKFEVNVGKKNIHLTSLEFKLLLHLMQNKGRVVTRESLLDQVWGYNAALTTRTVDTHIKRLREKLEKAGDYVETVRGVGYRHREKP